jgi:hypothetical protein
MQARSIKCEIVGAQNFEPLPYFKIWIETMSVDCRDGPEGCLMSLQRPVEKRGDTEICPYKKEPLTKSLKKLIYHLERFWFM